MLYFPSDSDVLNLYIYILQNYILTKHSNLRNYVCIGNEDANDLDIDDIYGRQKGSFIGVEHVWLIMKPNKQLLRKRNEFTSNSKFIKN